MSPQEFEDWVTFNTSGDDGWILIAHKDLPTNAFFITDEELVDLLSTYHNVKFLISSIS